VGAIGTSLALAASVVAATAGSAQAMALTAPAGSIGYDVSYPQCAGTVPTSGAFAIIGVNGGQAFTANPCLADQFARTSGHNYSTGLYVNTGNPGPDSKLHNTPTGTLTPALCADNTNRADVGCAYDYGWQAGLSAIAVATNAGLPVAARTWWLDVETENSWAKSPPLADTAMLQGELDSLRSHGVDEVGIYSATGYWSQITGGVVGADGYNTTNAAAYKLAWRPVFTPKVPLESVPLWLAASKTPQAACVASFTGAPVRLAQYIDANGFDADLACGPVVVQPPPAPKKPGVPRKPAAHMAHSKGIKLSWQTPSNNGGAVVTKYAIYRGTSKSAQSSYRTVSCTTSRCSWTDTKAKRHRHYWYKIAAINKVGTGSKTGKVDAKGR
jgi:hypothetical protein